MKIVELHNISTSEFGQIGFDIHDLNILIFVLHKT